jgi:hypothetical protein
MVAIRRPPRAPGHASARLGTLAPAGARRQAADRHNADRIGHYDAPPAGVQVRNGLEPPPAVAGRRSSPPPPPETLAPGTSG